MVNVDKELSEKKFVYLKLGVFFLDLLDFVVKIVKFGNVVILVYFLIVWFIL